MRLEVRTFNRTDAIRSLQNALQNLKTAIHEVKVVVKASREQAVIRHAPYLVDRTELANCVVRKDAGTHPP